MANSPSKKASGWGKYGDLKNRLIFLLLALIGLLSPLYRDSVKRLFSRK